MNPIQPIIDAVGADAAGVLIDIAAVAAEHLLREHGKDLAEGGEFPPVALAEWWRPALKCGSATVAAGERCCPHPIGKRGVG